MSNWQDISTAPRDGTRILVFTVHGEIELSDWYEIKREDYVLAEGTELYRKEIRTSVDGWNSNYPTHWMPLPEPPKASG